MSKVMDKEVKKDKKNVSYQRDKDHEKVRGIFNFYETPGGTVTFPFKKYKGDPVEVYTMTDGEIYTIPLMVAKHLNTTCKYPVHAFHQNESGTPSMVVGKKRSRMGFQSLEFIDESEIGASRDEDLIVTARPI